jgi:hypothetical protein
LSIQISQSSPGRPSGGHRLAPRAAASLKGLSSTWALGLVVALLTWNVVFVGPYPGLDPSWWAGLYMAAAHDLAFGRQVIFTYGPLGFLGLPWLWESGLGVLAFLFGAVLHVAICTSLIWALRRTIGPVGALVASFLLVVTGIGADLPVIIAGVWCLAALSQDAPGPARWLVLGGGAILGALELLITPRPGVAVLAMATVTLAAGPQRRRDLLSFAGLAAVALGALWLAAGQGVGNLPDFVASSVQVVTGYSEAMGTQPISLLYLVAEIALGLGLVGAAAGLAPARRPERLGMALVMAVAVFSIYKEAAVRSDFDHVAVFTTTTAGLVAALPFGRRRVMAIAAIGALIVVNIAVDHHVNRPLTLNPVTYVRQAGDQVRLLVSAHRRAAIRFGAAIGMAEHYRVPVAMLAALRGHTVDVSPWEIGVAWAYGLDWKPLPVLQNYTAYTAHLDALDARALSGADGPQRILREDPALLEAGYPAATIDDRVAAWDPPRASLAMLCHYAEVRASVSWEVLARVGDRCGTPRSLGEIHAREGAPIVLPPDPAGSVLYAAVLGAAPSGLERVRTLLWRARFRYVSINGSMPHRLVPGTAADGLVLDVPRGLDYSPPFALSPGARTLSITGTGGPVTLALYAMSLATG